MIINLEDGYQIDGEKYLRNGSMLVFVAESTHDKPRLFVCDMLADGSPDFDNLLIAEDVENWEGTSWEHGSEWDMSFSTMAQMLKIMWG